MLLLELRSTPNARGCCGVPLQMRVAVVALVVSQICIRKVIMNNNSRKDPSCYGPHLAPPPPPKPGWHYGPYGWYWHSPVAAMPPSVAAAPPMPPTACGLQPWIHPPLQDRSANTIQCMPSIRKKQRFNPTRDSFQLDWLCHPTGKEVFPNMAEAAAEMKRVHGGYHNGDQCLMLNGRRSKPTKDGVYITRFYCRAAALPSSEHAGWKCGWLAQIRETGKGGECVVHTKVCHNLHDHTMEEVPTVPKEQHGLNPTLAIMIDRYVNADGRCVLFVRPSTLLSHLCYTLLHDEAHRHLQFLTGRKDFRAHTKRQIVNYTAKHRFECTQEKLHGVTSVTNVDELSRLLLRWKIDIPPDYQARADYKSPSEIAAALSLPSAHHMLTCDLTNGPVCNTFQRKGVPKTTAKQKEFETKMEFSFFMCSATSLFMLLRMAQRRPGTRAGCKDGTGGLCREDAISIIFGCNSVACQPECDAVTSSFRAISCLIAGGERLYPSLVMLYGLRELSWKLFGIEFKLDWGECDHADAFINSYRAFKAHPDLCDESHRVLGLAETNLTQEEVGTWNHFLQNGGLEGDMDDDLSVALTVSESEDDSVIALDDSAQGEGLGAPLRDQIWLTVLNVSHRAPTVIVNQDPLASLMPFLLSPSAHKKRPLLCPRSVT